MGKVKLTKKQADVLEKAIKQYGEDLTVISHAKKYFHPIYEKELLELTTAEVAKALYIGYEIEPEFKIGDWVATKFVNTIGKTTKIVSETGEGWLNFDNGIGDVFEAFRHATLEEIAEEKQRRFWHENGRKFGEYKVNDVLSIRDSKYTWVITDVSVAIDGSTLYRFDNDIETTHKKAELLDRFIVVCFAHDRKDIKND